jgi:hypothetical protein
MGVDRRVLRLIMFIQIYAGYAQRTTRRNGMVFWYGNNEHAFLPGCETIPHFLLLLRLHITRPAFALPGSHLRGYYTAGLPIIYAFARVPMFVFENLLCLLMP